MADSFADLWKSSAPPPRKLGQPQPQSARRPQQDVFSLLASAPSSRPLTPQTNPQKSMPPPKPTATKNNGGDAFSSLLAGPLGSKSNNTANMTIAERAAQAEKERRENLTRHQQNVQLHNSAWDGLDTLASGSGSGSRASASATLDVDDWGFGSTLATTTTTKSPSVPIAPEEDDWGLGDFASTSAKPVSTPAPETLTKPSKSQAIWDLDDFASPSPPLRSKTPGDFDFGDREDGNGLLDDDSQDEDDILGALSKPVDASAKKQSSRPSPSTRSSQSPTHTPSPPITTTSRPVSPPPHILGQIVEMGFSVQQARIALASTSTGLDVQAALDTLLSNGAGAPSPRHTPPLPTRERERRPAPRNRERERERQRERDTPSPQSLAQSQSQTDSIQEQADKLIAQASEIGLSVFNKANAFWNQGKEKVQKAYEERAKSTASGSGGGGGGGGRPKWMQDLEREGDEERASEGGAARGKGFSDDASPPSSPPPVRRRPKLEPAAPKTSSIPNLFSDAEPVAYVSPFRRGKPKPNPDITSTPPPPSRPVPIQETPKPQPVAPKRPPVPTPPTVLKYKALGADKFKLGQYGEAEAAYTSALDTYTSVAGDDASSTPSSHPLLIPLYNNRALTRLKTGDYTGAIDDATKVIELVQKEGPEDTDLRDGLLKAWKRRAEAYEGKERWDSARRDWESVAGSVWASGAVRGEAVRGVGRCRRMVGGVGGDTNNNNVASTPVKPKPKSKPTVKPIPPRPSAVQNGSALNALRKANTQAEAEDQERHELKDTVDARLSGWKAGKETNIRALIASLDTVLWPELGWVKIGMAELVMPNQVKIRYTKAIAKVHPDKLNASNTTLEQRMIANGVFGALNEAWNAFKQ